MSIRPSKLPEDALLNKYAAIQGAYADCYFTEIDFPTTHTNYVNMFYTTWLFRIERFILTWIASTPSTDEQAQALAHGQREDFAAWKVEARNENQLLMRDFANGTRSWFMTVPLETGGARLYFGSAVMPPKGSANLGFGFRALLGFHKLYSIVLLYLAKSKLLARGDKLK